jgi:uncharacterized protein YhaN
VKIKRLYIGEMGIYRNALMEGINSKIVVIGGLNRAGKTTLLETLRHMAYGFPRNLRDSSIEFNVESDLVDEDNRLYTLKINGFKEPQVISRGEEKTQEIKQLYGEIDRFTYSQLYTVTLDELKKSNVKSDEEKLQAVLLGAGLKDIVHMPKLAEEFRKEKEKIGGKQGNPNIKAFKNSYDRLLNAVEERDKALKQLEEYETKCFQLKEIEKNIQRGEVNLHETNQKSSAFEFLKTYYNIYTEKKNLELKLESVGNVENFVLNDKFPSLERIEAFKEEYMLIKEQYEKHKDSFNRNVSENSEVYTQLIENRDRIREVQNQLSGFKERLENFKSTKESYEREKEQVLLSMEALNGRWKGDFVKVINIKCDSIEQDRLLNIIEGIREEEEKKRLEEKELDLLKVQKDALNKQASTIKLADANIYIVKYLYISIAILLAGGGLFMLSKPLGGAVALTGVITASLYWLIKYGNSKRGANENKEIIFQVNTLECKIEAQQNTIKRVQENIKEYDEQLEVIKKKLDIYNDISPAGLAQYLRTVSELKSRIINLGYSGKKLSKLQSEITSDLIKLNELTGSFLGEELVDEQELSKTADRIFNKLGIMCTWLQYGETLSLSENKLEEIEGRFRTLLNIDEESVLYYEIEKIIERLKAYNEYSSVKQRIETIDSQLEKLLKSERISMAVSSLCCTLDIPYENELICLYNLFDYYSAEEDISREYIKNDDTLKLLEVALESLREERRALKDSIRALSTSDKLDAAQREIDEARSSLKHQAEKYSVYAAAEYILESVQKNFINTAKDTILGGAGNIFDKITDGEYKALMPGDNLLQTDFKAMNVEGEVQNSTRILSRGTGEQLFLSVRISRIKDLKPKLPVVLDDPFVNFDSLHTRNTLKVISELSKENQIFILTCHSELVKLIGEISKDVQYWRVSKGKFEPSSLDALTEDLQ